MEYAVLVQKGEASEALLEQSPWWLRIPTDSLQTRCGANFLLNIWLAVLAGWDGLAVAGWAGLAGLAGWDGLAGLAGLTGWPDWLAWPGTTSLFPTDSL